MKRFSKPSDIKVGVIGYGGAFNMGMYHMREMTKAGMKVTAVAEIDPERRQAAREEIPGVETYPSAAAMLKKADVNLAVILTPHDSHARLAVQCLKAGRHVVCEKPLAITTAECDAMIAAARASRVVLSTYHNRHWDGCILRAVKQIGSGAVGEVIRVEARMGSYGRPGNWWRSSKSISGGILYDWGVHLLEYSLQILDANITEVSGFAKRGFWGPQTAWNDDCNEDEGFAVVRLAGDKWLTLRITSIDSNPKPGVIEVTGTKGSYVFDHRGWQTMTHRGKTQVTAAGDNPPGEGWRFYQNIADHLTKGEKLIITPEWSRRPIHILDLACKSAQKGASIKAKYK